ncbi:MAG: hypothetical protein QXW98_07535 [Candidatus Caldarchaeum sp.]
MPNWSEYFRSQRWLSLDNVIQPAHAVVIGHGVDNSLGKPSPYLVVRFSDNEEWRVRINQTSWQLLKDLWGQDPDSWVKRVVLIGKKKVKTRKGWTDALVVSPTDEEADDPPI